MSDRSPIFIRDRRSGEYCQAYLIDGVSAEQVDQADAAGKTEFEKAKREGAEHGHWIWRKKWDATKGILAYRFLGIECDEEMQGLMLLATAGKETSARVVEHRGKPLVYVHFIATAPWNSPLVV